MDVVSLFIETYAGPLPRLWADLYVLSARHGFELALGILALSALASHWRARSARLRLAALEAALGRQQISLLALERLQIKAERRLVEVDDRVESLADRQQRSMARESKVDYKLAVAMSRAGAGTRQMVDCGLSHSEAHLIQALNAASNARVPAGQANLEPRSAA